MARQCDSHPHKAVQKAAASFASGLLIIPSDRVGVMQLGTLVIKGIELPLYRCHTLVIGSGAASLNCAYHLVNFGVRDVAIVTEQLGGGTSNNSGSDKQTYYKLSLFGEGPDSVYDMARTLFSGGSMHGDIALIEAALSSQEFFHLVQSGVPFPHNEFGGYVGYKTDHDPKQRATSAGPWTSNQMYQCLLRQVRELNIPILDQCEIIFLLTDGQGDRKRVTGAIGIDKKKANQGLASLVVFRAENVVLGTGGPGGLYKGSVYPEGQLGSTGIALEVGAEAVNLTEWQYGLASTQFRWNVSGTYQQVIPRYISTDDNGEDEREFLNDYFPTMGKLATAIFLKGYQWPFDPRKIRNFGSSLIDILVYRETMVKGRRVFMDFRKNPSAGSGLGDFRFEDLEPEALEYLSKSGALFGTPLDRLKHMNSMAIDLYREHGIDLAQEPLEIAVCAQHNNGGLKGNIWWESNVRHLFPVGEVNGTHGVYRPGGSALNSGQVGGYRAAQFIANRYAVFSFGVGSVEERFQRQVEEKLEFVKRVLGCIGTPGQDMVSFRGEFQERMSQNAAHIRNKEQIQKALGDALLQFERIEGAEVSLKGPEELVTYFQNRQLCLTQLAVLKSIEAYLVEGGGSRGSYLVLDPSGIPLSDTLGPEWKSVPERESLRRVILEYQYENGNHRHRWAPVREIPKDDFWFENVWNAYRRREIFEGDV